uniref:Proteasome maturation protein n=1 Tax=Lygus hesperus TaxID=30085 RepID=A0A0A9X589_LYGHE
MSSGVPLMKPTLDGKRNAGLHLTEHGVHDSLRFGLCKVKENLSMVHPLENSEKHFLQNEEAARLTSLRNQQGIHAPMRLAIELKATRSIGRLPFLESSGLSTASLCGSDETIDFTDILGLPEFDERNLVPHVVMERKFGDF